MYDEIPLKMGKSQCSWG